MAKKYIVTLTKEERVMLETLTKTGKRAARTITRAHILLHADADLTDQAIAAALRVGTATVERVRKRFVLEGMGAALTERARPGGKPLLDGHLKRYWWPGPVLPHPMTASAGPCNSWPTNWSKWAKSVRFLTKPCAARLKKRP